VRTLRFDLYAWEEITRDVLYELLALRQLVFHVEQSCAYRDLDYADQPAHHLLGFAGDDRLVAYARLIPPGVKYAEPSIGRVVSHPEVRRTGAGRALMAEAILRAEALYGRVPVRIGAQRYLERFYASFGFQVAGEPYDEDGIAHIEMVRGSGAA